MIDNADIALNPSSGAASITNNDGVDTLTSNIGANDTLTLTDDGRGNSGSLGTAGFSNLGTLNAADTLQGSFTNKGILHVENSTTIDVAGGSFTQSAGTLTIGSAALTIQDSVNSTPVFNLNGGTITNSGGLTLAGGSFNDNGGTATGNAFLVNGAALALDPSSGSVSVYANNGYATLATTSAPPTRSRSSAPERTAGTATSTPKASTTPARSRSPAAARSPA